MPRDDRFSALYQTTSYESIPAQERQDSTRRITFKTVEEVKPANQNTEANLPFGNRWGNAIQNSANKMNNASHRRERDLLEARREANIAVKNYQNRKNTSHLEKRITAMKDQERIKRDLERKNGRFLMKVQADYKDKKVHIVEHIEDIAFQAPPTLKKRNKQN
ncbi:hypothetical protein WDU94_013396 [Cyamophila willieti]